MFVHMYVDHNTNELRNQITERTRNFQPTNSLNIAQVPQKPTPIFDTVYSIIYRSTILPVVLYGCETWSLTLRKEHRLRVFEKRVLKRIFGPQRDGVKGEWRKLHNEELNDLYSSANIVRVIKSRRMRWAGHVAHMEEGRGVHKVLVGKPEGKRPLRRPRPRWEDNIKMDLEEVGRGCGDWMELAKDRDRRRVLLSTVMNFRVP